MTMISFTDGTAFITEWPVPDVVSAWNRACEGRMMMKIQGVHINPLNIVAVYGEEDMGNFIRPRDAR